MKRRFVIAIALALASTTAWAKPKVAIVPLEGDSSGDAQDAITDALGDDAEVTGPKAVTRALDKLGFDTEMSDKDLKKLSSELEVDAIVRGTLTSKDGKQIIHFKLFVKGKKVKGFTVEFGSLKSSKFKEALHDKLVEKLGGEKKKTEVADEEKTKKHGDDEDKPKKTGDSDEDKPKKAADDDSEDRPKKHGDDDEDKPKHKRVGKGGDDDEEIEEVSTIKQPGHNAAHDAIRVDMGVSVLQRTLTFNSRSFEQAPKGYKNGAVPGGRLEAELYPLAFSNPNSAAAGLGIGGEFDQTFALNLQSTAQPGTKFAATERHYSIGIRYRIAFGSKATSPSLTIGAGYARHTFTVNRQALMMGNVIDLPDVDYKGYDPGILFRIPLGSSVALLFGGRALLVTGTGPIQTPAQYGQAKVTAGSGMFGLDFVFGNRYTLRLAAEASQMGFAFTGGAEMTNNRDGDPGTKDVGGAADRYIGGAATFGVVY
jgi:TolB-like protein